MVRPERRTKGDIVAVIVLVVAVLVGSAALWWNSDARATRSETAAQPIREPAAQAGTPDRLTELWRAPSPATPKPAVAGPAAVTGEGSEVLGRDPLTGRPAWSYTRDIPLCTVGSEWGRAIGVFRKSHNCSAVTSLRGTDGVRGPQRNSDVEFGTQLLSDGTYVTAAGRNIVESWRSDLVRTQQFGIPTAVKNPDNNMPRPDCQYSSVAVGDERVALIEKCPTESVDRVTMIHTQPSDSEEPEEVVSTLTNSANAEVIGVSQSRVAVLLPDNDQVQVFNTSGSVVTQYPVRTGPERTQSPGADVAVPAVSRGQNLYWHTGADTMALDPEQLTPRWNVPDARGPALPYGDALLVPVQDGLAVIDPNTGDRQRTIPVRRGDYTGPVQLNSAGSVVLEQRGDTLVALGPPGARD